MRGEHACDLPTEDSGAGSSPHARGAHCRAPVLAARPGIIPACAGSTDAPRLNPITKRDHPRMRGEHDTCLPTTAPRKGSSPHARGAPCDGGRALSGKGIIPACAGSTPARRQRALCSRDHPRMRGEHSRRCGRALVMRGSSPHTRGAHHGGAIKVLRGDHPRMRGEHSAQLAKAVYNGGSSPHARRALAKLQVVEQCVGIIPACAGSTWQTPTRACT